MAKKLLSHFSFVKLLIHLLICLFAYLLIFLPPVFAQLLPQQYLRISPIIEDVTLTPGKPTTYPLIIQNLANKPMGIHIDINGFDPTQTITLDGPTATYSPLVGWTSIPKEDVDSIVPAQSEVTIPVTITTPKDTKESGYYETFTITPFIDQQKIKGQPIVLTRFIGVVLATVGKLNYDNLAKKVSIIGFKPDSFIFTSNTGNLSFIVKNSYFTHFSAKPVITLHPLFGEQEVNQIEEKHIFPGNNRVWNISLPLSGNHFFYTADLDLSVGNGNQLFARTFFFVIPNFVIYGFLSAIVLLLIVLLRKRILKAMKILIKG